MTMPFYVAPEQVMKDRADYARKGIARGRALVAIRYSARPPDANHPYGHAKAEYFSAVLEGVLIVVAAWSYLKSRCTRCISSCAASATGRPGGKDPQA